MLSMLLTLSLLAMPLFRYLIMFRVAAMPCHAASAFSLLLF